METNEPEKELLSGALTRKKSLTAALRNIEGSVTEMLNSVGIDPGNVNEYDFKACIKLVSYLNMVKWTYHT